jgi:hypothetical protein
MCLNGKMQAKECQEQLDKLKGRIVWNVPSKTMKTSVGDFI